jgi:hypothetical protein
MKNAILRIGYTCASILVASGLTMTAAKAEQHDIATVNLPESVVVGSTTLPSGHYTITDEGNDVFLIHDDNGDHHAMVFGMKIETSKDSPKTEVVLKNDGEGYKLDKLYFEGSTDALDFE